MKKILAVLTAFVFTLTLMGCSTTEDTTTTPNGPVNTLPSGVIDLGGTPGEEDYMSGNYAYDNGKKLSDAFANLTITEGTSALELYYDLFDQVGVQAFDMVEVLNQEGAENIISYGKPGEDKTEIELANFVSGIKALPSRPLATDNVVILELSDNTNIDAVEAGIVNFQYSGVCVMPEPGTVHVTVNGNYVAYIVSATPYEITKTATTEGHNGDVTVNLSVTLDNEIVRADVIQNETPEVYQGVESAIVWNLQGKTSVEGLEVVAGATKSSEAVLEAVTAALASTQLDNTKTETFVNKTASLEKAMAAYNLLADEEKSKVTSLVVDSGIEFSLGAYAEEGFDYTTITSNFGFASEIKFEEGSTPTQEVVYFVIETTNTEAVEAMLLKAADAGSLGRLMFEKASVEVDGNLVILKNI